MVKCAVHVNIRLHLRGNENHIINCEDEPGEKQPNGIRIELVKLFK